MTRRTLALALAFALVACTACARPAEVRVGSKKFTESVILGDMVTELARSAGATATHRRQLGGTRVLWEALRSGSIDVYPEYTGTIAREILKKPDLTTVPELRQALAADDVAMSEPLGFDDNYAIGVPAALAKRLGLRTISDLARHPELRFGFSNEFLHRPDGWPSLKETYHLPQTSVRGMDHDLAYRALQSGAIDATDLYSTDAEVVAYGLKVLEDDRHLFPTYRAVLLYRPELARRAPKVVAQLARLAGTIDAEAMRQMNARVKLKHVPEARVAADFLAARLGVHVQVPKTTFASRLARRTKEHLFLVLVSLAAAILLAIPLGVLAARRRRLGQAVLAVTGLVQTIPSLALLVFMIPLLGIGAWPAIAALFLYALLPIVRNTHAGLTGIPPELRESAEALGLPPMARLWRIDLPLAAPAILAGIQTAAVIDVGTATLGALIGAGGYGQPILTGIRLADVSLILQGAIPAALLALLVQGLFELIGRRFVPRGLRGGPTN